MIKIILIFQRVCARARACAYALVFMEREAEGGGDSE